MKAKLLARLERLEAMTALSKPLIFRYGWLKPLPRDFEGERHVVIVEKHLTDSPGIEWCEFEERPGPAPAGLADGGCTVYLMREALDCSDVAL